MNVVLKEFVSKPPKKRHLFIEGRSLFEPGASSMLMPLLMPRNLDSCKPTCPSKGAMATFQTAFCT